MAENPNLRLLVEALGYLSAMVLAICTAYSVRVKAKRDEAALAHGVDPKSLPEINVKPLLLFAVGGALLAYLFAQHPEMALRPLEVLPEAPASAAKAPATEPDTAASCTKDSDCGSGGKCRSGRCQSTARQAPTQRQAPRRVASLNGELCADCPNLPWDVVEVQTIDDESWRRQ